MAIARPVAKGMPRRVRLSRLDVLGAAAFLLTGVAFYMALLWAPTELIEGEPQRIFYVHVPMVIAAYLSFIVVFLASALYLWKRKTSHDIVARSAAEVGVLFLTLVLISGGLWGQATWGTFWQWEPRLTFTFILWLIYVGYLMLRQASENRERMARYAAVLGIIGFADIPMVSLSVYLWRGLHPEPAAMPGSMAMTFLVSLVAFALLFWYLLLVRIRIDRTREKIEELRAEMEEKA